jgi:hypothetical protein
MRPGLDADDAYIMVEDEFLATARTFTAHLHHAEYKRLKALARERKRTSMPSPFPGPGSGDDSTLPTLLKRKKAAGANLARSRAALESIGAMKSSRSGSSTPLAAELDENDSGPDFSSKRSPPQADDPWLGTSLAPLLSPQKRRKEAHLIVPPSLAGLKGTGARSNTRAARGYPTPVAAVRPGQQIEPELPLPSKKSDIYSTARVGFDDDETEGDDDLDTPHLARPAPRREEAKRSPKLSRLPSPPPLRNRESVRKDKEESRVHFKEVEAELPAKFTPAVPAAATKPRIRPWLKKRDKDGEDSGTRREAVNVNEIPTFLV